MVVFLFTVLAIRLSISRRCSCCWCCSCSCIVVVPLSSRRFHRKWIIREKRRNVDNWAITDEGDRAVRSISRATDGPTFWAGPPLRNDGGSRTNKHRPIAPLCSKRLKLRSPPRLNLTSESVSNRGGEWNGKAHAWFTDFAVSARVCRVARCPRVFFVFVETWFKFRKQIAKKNAFLCFESCSEISLLVSVIDTVQRCVRRKNFFFIVTKFFFATNVHLHSIIFSILIVHLNKYIYVVFASSIACYFIMYLVFTRLTVSLIYVSMMQHASKLQNTVQQR